MNRFRFFSISSRTDTFINRLDVCTNSALDWNKNHNPVYEFAQKENLNLYEWPLEDDKFIDCYDVGIVVSFGYLIPEKIIDALPLYVIFILEPLCFFKCHFMLIYLN